MVERRSLSDAVDLTPKLEAFIKSGIPKEPSRAEPTATPLAENSASETVVHLPQAGEPASGRRGRPRRASRIATESGGQDTDSRASNLLDEILVPLTTKLRRRTVQALRRAYLEQKLHGRKPATQQEIIEEAVGEWLSQNGFQPA